MTRATHTYNNASLPLNGGIGESKIVVPNQHFGFGAVFVLFVCVSRPPEWQAWSLSFARQLWDNGYRYCLNPILYSPISTPERDLQVCIVLYFPISPPERKSWVVVYPSYTVFSPVAEVTEVAKLPETVCLPTATGNRTRAVRARSAIASDELEPPGPPQYGEWNNFDYTLRSWSFIKLKISQNIQHKKIVPIFLRFFLGKL